MQNKLVDMVIRSYVGELIQLINKQEVSNVQAFLDMLCFILLFKMLAIIISQVYSVQLQISKNMILVVSYEKVDVS